MAATVLKALRAKLIAESEITGLVAERIYPTVIPQGGSAPCIVLKRISTRPEHTLSGMTRLSHSRIQFDCLSETDKDEADAIAKAVQNSGIDSYQGTTLGITFHGAEFERGDEDEVDNPTDGNEEFRYITTFDLLIHYWEAE